MLMSSFDVLKSSSRFLLRQMVMASSEASRTASNAIGITSALKLDLQETQRKLASVNNEASSAMTSLQAKLVARDQENDNLRQHADALSKQVNDCEEVVQRFEDEYGRTGQVR
jgi:chromosome segregation ATPase